MEDVSDSLANLLSTPSKEIRCVESIVFSSLNPPPSYRRFVLYNQIPCMRFSCNFHQIYYIVSAPVQSLMRLQLIFLLQASRGFDLPGCGDTGRE